MASHRNQDSLRAMEGQVPNHVGEKQTWSAQENAKKRGETKRLHVDFLPTKSGKRYLCDRVGFREHCLNNFSFGDHSIVKALMSSCLCIFLLRNVSACTVKKTNLCCDVGKHPRFPPLSGPTKHCSQFIGGRGCWTTWNAG